MDSTGKVLVTGANGFLGTALLQNLVERHIEVLGTVRSADSDLNPVPGVSYVSTGNIDGKTRWGHGLPGVEVIIHCAARVHIMSDAVDDPLQAFRTVNRDGTLNLARQAAAAGVRRFVFISTTKVNGEHTHHRSAFGADDAPAPVDPYGISKREAEDGLLELARQTGMEVVIVRPPLVYGPGVKGNFRSLLKLARLPIPLPFGAIRNRRSLVYLGNLVNFVICAAQDARAANQTFLVSDGEDLSTAQLLNVLRQLSGRAGMLVPVPPVCFWWMGALLGKKPLVQRLCGSLQLDVSKTHHLLGWVPPFSVEQGLTETVNALR